MKPEQEVNIEETENVSFPPVAGDVIGDTAYSERFVLKILLKLANLDTLKHEVKEKAFEDDLCILWDMTAERDVVLFLQKHDVLKLFNFALPVVDSPRIIEIIVGIIGNMCCQKEVVTVLLKMDTLLALLLDYINTDDSLLLVQLLRLVSSCLFVAEGDDITQWMDLFVNMEYSKALYFILNNSSNKDLLVTALENLNTICSYCNIEKTRSTFFTQFVTLEALESLNAAFTEITTNQKDRHNKDELERILVISLQIALNLLGFDKSLEVFINSKENVTTMINIILKYYENKLANHKEIDTDLVDIIEGTTTIVNVLQISESSDPDKYFDLTCSMWRYISLVTKPDQNGSSFEDEDKKEIKEFSENIKPALCTLMCIYISKCSEDNLLKALDRVQEDYEDIINLVRDKELQKSVSNRADNYRTRLKENTDS